MADADIRDYWLLYVSDDAALCSLCGNSGIIDTRATAVSAAGVNAGRLNYCICPNGQAMRSTSWPLERGTLPVSER